MRPHAVILAMVQDTRDFHSHEQHGDPLICHQIEPVGGPEGRKSTWVKASVYPGLALLMRGTGGALGYDEAAWSQPQALGTNMNILNPVPT